MSAAHASSAAHTQDVIQPNEEVKGVAVTKKAVKLVAPLAETEGRQPSLQHDLQLAYEV
jgi:hypothetical protein